jgi:hypothetical protein
MPGSGDYFSQYLKNDFDSLDKEMSGAQWFQKEQERDSQKELAEQNELEKGRVEEEKESPASSTADPFRPTYDRKKSSESKKERLERIKKEYEHKPFISVGAWEDLRKRRDKRKQVQQQIVDQSFRDGLSANSPNLTQEVEQNEPTIMPPQRFSSVKPFCKKAAWEEEDDPDAADWWKGEPEPKPEPMEEKPWYANLKLPGGLQEDLPFVPFWAKKMKFDPKELDVVPQLTKPENEYTLNINNIKDKMRDFALNIYPKKIVEINKGLIEKGMKPIFSYEDALESDNHLPLEFLEEYQNDVSPSVYSEEMHNALALEETGFDPIGQAWEDLAGEEPGKGREFSGIEKEVDRRIKELTKDQNREVNPSAEDLEKWLKSSGAKRFCKRAGKSVFATLNDIMSDFIQLQKLLTLGTLSGLSEAVVIGFDGLAGRFRKEFENGSPKPEIISDAVYRKDLLRWIQGIIKECEEMLARADEQAKEVLTRTITSLQNVKKDYE